MGWAWCTGEAPFACAAFDVPSLAAVLDMRLLLYMRCHPGFLLCCVFFACRRRYAAGDDDMGD